MGKYDARQPDKTAKRFRDVIIVTMQAVPGDIDNADIGEADILVIDDANGQALSGLQGGFEGRRVDIVNTDEVNLISLQNQNNNSDPENQFRMAADIDLTAEEAVTVIYIAERWRPIAAG